MPTGIKLYKQFYDVVKANIVREKLLAHNIPCFLTNENTFQLGFLNGGNLTVGLMLHRNDFQMADQVLADSGLLTESTEEDETESCPFCHSTNIAFEHHYKNSVRFNNLMRTLFGNLVKEDKTDQLYFCFNCSREFKEPLVKISK